MIVWQEYLDLDSSRMQRMSNLNGLKSAEAAERLKEYGSNSLPQPQHRLLRLVLRQFSGIFNLLLLAAAAVTFALGETVDGAFILFLSFWARL
ncbi:MAG TPA: cation-transporting P-type ATPase [Methanothrix sp.]|nr:cation-transporting P-type ATPase [Methanothrix sp.]HUM81825.1 cation-transporting P-type ATPase [Methanothrix sp.]